VTCTEAPRFGEALPLDHRELLPLPFPLPAFHATQLVETTAVVPIKLVPLPPVAWVAPAARVPRVTWISPAARVPPLARIP